MIITFCGHDHVEDPDGVQTWLGKALDPFLCNGEVVFYLGGYGGFDRLAAAVVCQKKKQYPKAQAILVIPYLNRAYDTQGYDDTVFPPLESVPPKFAISKRNEWMISRADVVIAYVTHSWGGAAKSLAYARKKKKTILQYPEL